MPEDIGPFLLTYDKIKIANLNRKTLLIRWENMYSLRNGCFIDDSDLSLSGSIQLIPLKLNLSWFKLNIDISISFIEGSYTLFIQLPFTSGFSFRVLDRRMSVLGIQVSLRVEGYILPSTCYVILKSLFIQSVILMFSLFQTQKRKNIFLGWQKLRATDNTQYNNLSK